MSDKNNNYMQNREISWLRFNDRVLSEASQNDVAAFEKLKFISIFVSNLDEFFMVRVGSLHDMTLLKKQTPDSKTGMSPKEQINAILDILPDMYNKKDALYKNVMKELENYNIKEYLYSEMDDKYKKFVKNYYRENIKPAIFAQIIDKQHPFPFIDNAMLSVVLELEKDKEKYLGIIEIPSTVSDFILLPGEAIDFIRTENVVYDFADEIFSGYNVKSKSIIKITRNFDLDADSELADEFDDYKDKMKMILKKRKRQSVVRLESNNKIADDVLSFLLDELDLNKKAYFIVKSPLNMKYVFKLLDVIPTAKQEKILYPKYTPYYLNRNKKSNMMETVSKKDMLLSYPYDDMMTFIDLLKEASEDDRVISIKITIYRLAKNSKIAKYLCQAAENGKDVTVCMELKARFDEESNINYANTLYQSGCKIIYGFEKYKVHSKLCLITYKDDIGTCHYITQIGTGNYNESTSKIYADFSLITGNREIGLDASDFFNNMTIGNLNGKYEHIVQSPSSLKDKFIKLIDREIEKGSDGFLFFKMNSFTDKDFIEKLSEASKNNVKVVMIIRGICCLLPGVQGETDNVEVRSIVGRFLEHSRVYQFGKGDCANVYIGSADLMTRNTEQRVEVACPVYDVDIKREIENYIKMQLNDNVKGRKMKPNGEYEIVLNNSEPFDSQEYFLEKAKEKQFKDLLKIENSNSSVGSSTESTEKKDKNKGFFAKLFGNN